ncbi:hypothetical protein DPMN_064800 [Dreissena polymorpha]|uniref:Uncharacterized protein n=1 Tax=Dreissena polymorpha TaxID=45954 RepID=A0A9D4CDT9_DREPO|nr:hypothetical protein DPMN_064800 [Dreissena polymorpha]
MEYERTESQNTRNIPETECHLTGEKTATEYQITRGISETELKNTRGKPATEDQTMREKTKPERLETVVKTYTDRMETEVKSQRIKIGDIPTTERNKSGNKTKIELWKTEGKSVYESQITGGTDKQHKTGELADIAYQNVEREYYNVLTTQAFATGVSVLGGLIGLVGASIDMRAHGYRAWNNLRNNSFSSGKSFDIFNNNTKSTKRQPNVSTWLFRNAERNL